MLALPVFQQLRGLFRDRRRAARFDGPGLMVVIDGRLHPVADWSPGGVRIASRPGRFEPGQEVRGDIAGLGVSRPAPFRAEVGWLDAKGRVGLRFLELPPALAAAMAQRGRADRPL